ncbi:MAG TPA: hypothetical protein VFC58_09855 [Desulfosporosinus sp.]|nr:hypothetical protein [Desulfosporosinus sp.]
METRERASSIAGALEGVFVPRSGSRPALQVQTAGVWAWNDQERPGTTSDAQVLHVFNCIFPAQRVRDHTARSLCVSRSQTRF